MAGQHIFWGKFDEGGVLVEQRLDGGARLTDAQQREDGFEPVLIPDGVRFGDWTGFSKEHGFEWPPHLKDWRAFRMALLSEPEYLDVDAAAMESTALTHRVHSFNDTLRELIDGGATPQELKRFQFQWGALETLIQQKQFANYTGVQVAAKIREIADNLSIILDYGELDFDGSVSRGNPDSGAGNYSQSGHAFEP